MGRSAVPVLQLPSILLALLLTTAAHAEIPVPHVATFGRWFVACDNTRRCEAWGVPEARGADLRLIREPGRRRPSLILTTTKEVVSPLRIDGERVPGTWRAGKGEDPILTLTDPAQIAQVLTLARAGHQLTAVDDVAVPLDGLPAALRRIDDVQASASAILPPKPRWRSTPALANAAELAVATRAGQSAALQAAKCTPQTDRDEAHALDPAHAVVLLQCWSGAFQQSAVVVIVARTTGQGGTFAPTLPAGLGQSATLMEAGFDTATGQLSTSARGRGMADCGQSAIWVWVHGAFRMAHLSYQAPCGGAEPGDWPAIYRTR